MPRARIPRLVRIPIVLAGLCLAGCSPGAGPPSTPAALELPDPGGLDPAVAELLQGLLEETRSAPRDAAAAGRLGLALEANLLPHEAERAFARASALDPAEPHWRLHRAIALESLGDHAAALELFRDAARALPAAAYAAQRLGEAALDAGAPDEARAAFLRTIELQPEAAEGHTGLGASLLALGRAQEAAAALERAIALDPEYKCAHYRLGLAYRALGRLDDAERELAQGLLGEVRFLPDPFATDLRRFGVGETARLVYGLSLLEGGRPERAVRVLQNLLERDPENVTVLNDLAIALQRSGDLEGARARLEQALALDDGVPSTWINLASLALDQNTTARALECAEHALALAPDSAKARLMRGRVLLRQHRDEEAVQELEAAWRADPRELSALELAAATWLGLGDLERARDAYETLARERPYDPLAHVGLARVALRGGERAHAEEELTRARALAPDHPEVVALGRELEVP